MSHTWKRIWARKYAPFIASTYFDVFSSNKNFPFCLNKLFLPEGNLYAIYFEETEWASLVKSYTDFLLKQNIQEYSIFYEKQFKDFLDWSLIATKQDFSQSSLEGLIIFLQELNKKLISFGEWQFLSFVVLEGPGKQVEKYLELNPDKDKILEWITTPDRHTLISQARQDLLDLVLEKKTTEQNLEAYIEKYAWLPMYEFIDSPLKLTDLKKQIECIEDAAEEKMNFEKNTKENLKQFEEYRNSLLEGEYKKLVDIVHAFTYLKEMRDDYRRQAYFCFIPFWNEIARRLDISLVETNYLLADEIISALLGHLKDYKEKIVERMKHFSLVLENGKMKIFEIDKSNEYFGSFENVGNFVKGVSAARGIVQGKVKIIYHQGEFSKFEKGDILVTTMTHPEFLPIMKQALAIVTDEGGITCHAAIVARELLKPCVIATTNATKIFKDGDMVEVNGETGIVKKLL